VWGRDAYRALVAKPERRTLLGKPRRWRIILKWIFERLDKRGIDWIDLAQDKDMWRASVNTAMNLRVP
jgi:hypothetical protein